MEKQQKNTVSVKTELKRAFAVFVLAMIMFFIGLNCIGGLILLIYGIIVTAKSIIEDIKE